MTAEVKAKTAAVKAQCAVVEEDTDIILDNARQAASDLKTKVTGSRRCVVS